jgi:hypothetical protein
MSFSRFELNQRVGVTVLKRTLPWLVMCLFWIVVYGPGLVNDAKYVLRPDVMCDDVRIVIYHFFHWSDSALFANDELGKYHSDGTGDLFRVIFFLVAKIGNPFQFTKLSPYFLYLITVVGIGASAYRLGGKIATFVAVTLCLGSWVFLARTAGFLPRAFAFPIIAWMLVALVYGRIRLLAFLTVLGTGLYPVLTVIGGLCLSVWLFVMSAKDRGEAEQWSLRRRSFWFTGTVALCVVVILPFQIRMHSYGAAITPDMVEQFPEAGLGGRQDSATRPPFASLAKSWMSTVKTTMSKQGEPLSSTVQKKLLENTMPRDHWMKWLLFASVLGCVLLTKTHRSQVYRLSILVFAVAIGYVLSNAVTPRLIVPPRYTLYGVPLLTILVISVAPMGLWSEKWRVNSRLAAFLRLIFLCSYATFVLVIFAGSHVAHAGVRSYVKEKDREIFKAIGRLPKEALIAGWPEGMMETMPIVSLRSPFLTRELHVPYHTKMTLMMRNRMNALIAAYYATDEQPLIRLRDEFKVTHLVAERSRFDTKSTYFRPFASRISRAFERGNNAGFYVKKLCFTPATIYDQGDYFLIDLSRLPNENNDQTKLH